MKKIIITAAPLFLFAFDIKPIDLTGNGIKKASQTYFMAKDGKKVFKDIGVVIKPMNTTIVKPMQVPIIYAIGDKPKPQAPAKETQKPKPIDKSAYFTDKEALKAKEVKTEQIKIDSGTAFFESLNKEDNTPVDIEKE